MDRIEINRARRFKGEFSPPPDKSISHRAVILSSISKGKGVVKNVLRAEDTKSTIKALRAVGTDIRDEGDRLIIRGNGLRGLSEPPDIIDCGNSGTTIRLLPGILAGNPFFSVLTGDDSLRTRPMARVIEPLAMMGAEIRARSNDKFPPIAIRGGGLQAIKYSMPVASAQVKSCLLLAGLYSEGETSITEPAKSRDHTERMLAAFGADIKVDGLTVSVNGGGELTPVEVEVPGDFSSAAFFIVAALLVPGGEITLKNVGINPARTGLLDVLKKMGADFGISNIREVSGEPVADIYCKGGSGLKAVSIGGSDIPSLIDEFPILCVAASFAEGTTTITGAEELRVKESDRIASIASELRKMGVEIEEYADGLSINGGGGLHGALMESHGDHRIAMSMTVAALNAEGGSTINGISSVDISFPDFFEIIGRMTS
ncbi:MAG: 3-phosphoshikimate 1-carboxyvinyltransferase [Nitrospirota bacterium]|nr:3-phosphoshikimate 1-carboxyvinyltransferase [Nitrospirota bacterium]